MDPDVVYLMYVEEDLELYTENLLKIQSCFPGREKQIELLYSLICMPGDPLPESVYLFGDSATGKTKVIEGLLRLSKVRFSLVNCIECYTPRLLLHSILDGLFGSDDTANRSKCDSLMSLVKDLKQAFHANSMMDKEPWIIVLDNCERLFDLGDHYFNAFQKLQELTSIPSLSVIFISQLLPEKFTAYVPCVRIHFPQYSKDDMCKIIMMEFMKQQSDEAETVMFKQFLSILLDTFLFATKDLNELKYQSTKLFKKYLQPVKTGQVKATDIHALYKNISPHIKTALSGIYVPGDGENNDGTPSQKLDLPYFTKYLLIAAFLASNNLPKEDKRLFVKNHGKIKKRIVQNQKKENHALKVGPKIFPLARLLAIFYSITEVKTPLNSSLMSQIATLVELQLLVKIGDDLDKPKYKCGASIDCVEAVASTLNFNVRKYMVN